MENNVIENTYQVSSPARLKLGNIRGSVVISTGIDGEVFIRAEKHPKDQGEQNTHIEMEQASDGQVIVKTWSNREGFHIFHNHPCQVEYTVRLPQKAILDISGVSNSLSVNGFDGEFRLESVSGVMELEKLNGSVKISTVSGDIRGLELTGPLEIDTVSGNIRLERSNIPSLRGETVSGEMNIDTTLGQGPYHVNSVSGDLVLSVPGDTSCTVKINSLSGRASLDLPVTSKQQSHGRMVADINGGGTLVHYGSVSGCLAIHTGDAKPPAPPQPQPARPSRKDILEKIDRGEISVDEGIGLLSST